MTGEGREVSKSSYSGSGVQKLRPDEGLQSSLFPLPPLACQYGTAGDQVPFTSFVGLADFPALDAFLFDPRQPSGQKYRKLARTMIPRLYHSAALLTADGTVLVEFRKGFRLGDKLLRAAMVQV